MTFQDSERETELEQLVQRAERGERQAVCHLIAMLEGGPNRQQEMTLSLLARHDDPGFWRDLLTYLAGEGWQQRRLAPPGVAARKIVQRLFIESFAQPFTCRQAALHAALTAASPSVRALAVTLLGKRGDQAALPMLVGMLADPAPPVQVAAAHALQAMPELQAVEALLATMAAGDLGVRLAAADALCAIGRPALSPLLRRLISQPTRGAFRDAAAHALPHLAHGVPSQEVAALEVALCGPAAAVTVPVAADRMLSWCAQHPAVPC